MKRVRSGHELDGEMRDDVPLATQVADEARRVDAVSCERGDEAALGFEHVGIRREAAAGRERRVDGRERGVARVVLARPAVGADGEPADRRRS